MADKWWQRAWSAVMPDTSKAARPGKERPITLAEMLEVNTGSASDNVYGTAGGQLGPGPPPLPMPLGGDPRQMYYRPGWNIPSPPGEGRPLSADDLRALSYSNYLARRCIEVRKKEIIGLNWGIVPKGKNRKKVHEIQVKLKPLIKEITAFFEHPVGYMEKDAEGKWVRRGMMTKAQWLDMLLEDHFVLDAMTIYPDLLANGNLLSLRPIDGSTIKPLLTLSGTVPPPPYAAYEQWLYGRANAQFRYDQLYYLPFNRRVSTPYGFSLVEQNLLQINKVLRYEMWVSAYFTDGAMPEGGFEAPPELTPDQARLTEMFINAKLAGNAKSLRGFNIWPSGLKWVPLKPFTFDDKLNTSMMVETCLSFDVQPQELGLLPEGHLGGHGSTEGQENVMNRKSLRPLAEQLSSIFTHIIERYWGVDDLEFKFFGVVEEDNDDPVVDQQRLFAGLVTWDALLESKGQDPVGLDEPFVVIGNQTVLGAKAIKQIIDNDGTTPKNVAQQTTQDAPPVTIPDDTQDATKAAQIDHHAVIAAVNNSTSSAPATNAATTQQEDAQEKKRPTHKEELLFIAAYKKLFGNRGAIPDSANTADAIAASLAYTSEETQALAQMIADLKGDAYTSGINTVLKQIGAPQADGLKDIRVKAGLHQEATKSASEVAQTFSDDARSAANGMLDADVAPDVVRSAMKTWQQERAAWKGEQIGQTESAQPFTQGAHDVVTRNQMPVKAWEVTPEQCKCDRCQAMVDANPWPASYGTTLAKSFPLHPNCIHGIKPIFDEQPSADSVKWRG